MEFEVRNVNGAFERIVRGLHNRTIPAEVRPSRNGRVLQIPEPVTIKYLSPRERVLLNPRRDANPFFHLYESLWMLAGRNDVKPLVRYASTIGNYSDDGKTFNGAYGCRWRRAAVNNNSPFEKEIDQLNVLIDHLRTNPESRRAVLQMWNVEDDLLKIDASKDVCCNLSVCFSVREVDAGVPGIDVPYYVLDMTVFNRSNDLIWGALGANVVHFSCLQEYVANCLKIGVGYYYQVTNNLHVYLDNNSGWKPEEWLDLHRTMHSPRDPSYGVECEASSIPLVSNKETFDEEVKRFVEEFSEGVSITKWQEPFLEYVAKHMMWAFGSHKRRDYVTALQACNQVQADDWRLAATNWILKRKENWEKNGAKDDTSTQAG